MFHRRSRRRDLSPEKRRSLLLRKRNTSNRPGNYDLAIVPYRQGFYQRKGPFYDLRLIVLRHGERVDTAFGSDWFEKLLYDKNRNMTTYQNPNLPRNLPRRKETYHYILDPPITRQGEDQARLFGIQLKSLIDSVDYCYSSSPSRCVLTANAVLEGMGQINIPIRIEPYLFEPLNWNSALHMFPSISSGLSRGDWVKANYNIATRYHRLGRSLDPNEKEDGFYRRTQVFLDHIMELDQERRERRGNTNLVTTVLAVGHASSPVIFEEILSGFDFDLHRLEKRSEKVGFLDTIIFRREANDGHWVKQKISPSPQRR